MPVSGDAHPRRTIVVLGMLSTFGPISLDLYLPSLPELSSELNTSTSSAQLTITACLLGLAVGQLIAGPLSDQFGRRRPLLIGLVAYLLASLACAFAPTIELLIVLRLLQGLAGAAGLVIARAVARDLYSGNALLIFFARLTLVSGLAPVVAPLLGGQLARVMDWRGIFVVLAGFGLVLVLAGLLGVPESLPPEQRSAGGLQANLAGFRELLADRLFLGAAFASGLAGAAMFAYIAGATFVLQRIYLMSPQGFSYAFGINALGIMAMAQVGARLARTWPTVRVLGFGLGLNLLGAVGVLVSVLFGAGLVPLLIALWVMVSSVGLVFPTATTIALADYPHQAGRASSLLGLGQYIGGALVAPLVGLAGEHTAVPMGVVVVGVSVAAGLVFWFLVVRTLRSRGEIV
ncbi:putative drug resistance transporter [Microlunatus phosphovorus NM-1]|uniref:Putative drug resistance transporter n=1 Tax=Microlunatus phosphovorus (strain ATCC 700054 / DSM 10555 / JCM 9379 / NBRC 101784 / NCIMB 13414 / VKM Ac-1990 / NM-1) TaxID=1032480 RepID=F5XRK4_MICPN|nr:multidrug effflux MFS transporter [Microlunatus phosphovorus]BAK34694.1 putative drug resistance transporter [Microlunatus phosphovorus NM-1]